MNDTPQHIKELQLKIWLSKSPGERLKQFMEDNASLFLFWNTVQKSNNKQSEKIDAKSFDLLQ
ncbi:hypothetical protein [Chitinophaga sp. S165]|uniref:hypothetical protein n=1 Tax=Chitinophaga sp. S165 TaxID=2135462 RepID=UPI000D7186CE|nr:hypothetical protein [Chitinophaga sp. S165]PWV46529.1 hypothetical protein C7475_11089 [Chitinophaga sp. S165]